MLIDPKSQTPIYRQIADQLRQSIDAGIYKTGEMLPSLRQLAVEIKVNPNTIQRAYDNLEREGVVESRRGVGIFVSGASRQRLNAAETQLQEKFSVAIGRGIKAGLNLANVRRAFEEAIREYVQGATK